MEKESRRESVAPPPPPPPFTAHLKDNPAIVYGDTRDTLVDVVRGGEDSRAKPRSLLAAERTKVKLKAHADSLDGDLHFMVCAIIGRSAGGRAFSVRAF